MRIADDPMFFVVLVLVFLGWASVLTSLARVQAVDDSGITLRTLGGQRRLAWSDLRAPVRFWSRTIWVHIVLEPRHVKFLTLRRGFMVVGGLEESERIVEVLRQHISVAQGRVF